MSENLFGKSGGGLAGGMSGGLQMAAIALLVQQLMKHSRGTATEAPAPSGTQAAPAQGGGLGDILGGLLGGGAGAAASGGILGGLLGGGGSSAGGGILGGLGGLLGGLRGHGMEDKVNSWVQPGPNQSVSADELSRAFDPKDIDAAAREAGTDRGGLMQEVSRLLPEFVDKLTPQGRVPERETDLGSGGLGGLLGSLFGGQGQPRR
jgi:uncharacterized protein YidB (DUF937 family)